MTFRNFPTSRSKNPLRNRLRCVKGGKYESPINLLASAEEDRFLQGHFLERKPETLRRDPPRPQF